MKYEIGYFGIAIEYCQDIIKLKGETSLNVSVAGSIIIYDRITKTRGIFNG